MAIKASNYSSKYQTLLAVKIEIICSDLSILLTKINPSYI